MVRIAVDGNGGDYGLETTVVGSVMAVKKFPNLQITIYGDEEKINKMKEFYKENIYPNKNEFVSTLIKLDNVSA